jgi:hypothetical protein
MNRLSFAGVEVAVPGGVLTLLAVLGACGGRAASDPAAGAPGGSVPAPQGVDDDVVAVLLPSGLRIVTHDGVVRSALDGDPILDGVTGGSLSSNGGYLFADLVREAPDGSVLEERGALLTGDGTPLWRQSIPHVPGAYGAIVGTDGAIVRATDGGTTVLRADGSSVGLPDLEPNGATTPDSFLAVRANEATLQAQDFKLAAANFGWWRVGGGAPAPLSAAPAQEPMVIGRAMVYARADAPDTSLMIETPEGARRIDLPTASSWGPPSYDLGAGRWLVVRGSDPGARTVWRVDLSTGQRQRFDIAAPGGFRAFALCGSVAPIADLVWAAPDGQLSALLRTDDRAALFQSNDGQSWSQVGEAVTGVGSFRVRVAGGTFALLASSEVPCYTPGPTWTPPSGAAITPEATQLVRPIDAGSVVRTGLSPARELFAAAFSGSGRYAAYWASSNAGPEASLHVIDVATGDDRTALVDPTGKAQAPTWVAARIGGK